MLSPYSYLQHDIGWLLAIGQRLRVEYDAVMQPMPPRLIELLGELRAINGEAVHGQEQEKTLFRRAARHQQAAVVNSTASLYQG
jgi:hypothetical protein